MEKLYEAQPYLTQFSATVESCTQGKKGWDILLNQTAFYPEGGGQPYDTGTLGGVPVLEVHQREGRVIHTCAAPLEAGSPVEGQIDWPRRFDLMRTTRENISSPASLTASTAVTTWASTWAVTSLPLT